MQLRRTVFGSVIATGLILGLTGCGGNDQATQPTPVSDTPSPTMSTPPTPTPTPVDPVAAAKVKVLADYKNYVAFQTRGVVTNDPVYPYEQVMTGNALRSMKSVVTGMNMMGRKYSGSLTFLKGSVVALNLKAKPATATVQACEMDALVVKDKKGKTLTAPPAKVSTDDRLVLVGGRWKVTETTTLDEHSEGCTR
ncbi:MAG: hypothetical protein QOF10_3591 [Kribbellaceae bacterium]|jgi:hypothetical protein|nr:hypothetical protein [Kribbellaceae bacterium]